MTLISDSMNYPAHERASLALENEFGHEHVRGKHAKRNREEQPDFPRAETTLAEEQQALRTGINPEDRKNQITVLKIESDNAQAFTAALEDAGYIFARGDRGYLVIDENGDHFTLAKQLREKTAAVNAFMAEVPLSTLPSLAEAKALVLDRKQAQEPQSTQTDAPTGPTQEDLDKVLAAVKARYERENRTLVDFQHAEYKHAVQALDAEKAEKLDNLKALHKDDLAMLSRKPEEYSDDWIRKFGDIIKHRWDPSAAERQRLERQQQIEAIRTRHRIERDTLIETLKLERAQRIDDLKDRHARQETKLKGRYTEEIDRYKQEHQDAQRLWHESAEEQRRQKQERKRDGPEPPKPLL